MAGLTRWVLPPAPCRPSKFRLEVEAQRSPLNLTGGTGSQILGQGEKTATDAEVIDFFYLINFPVYRYFSIYLKRNAAEATIFF